MIDTIAEPLIRLSLSYAGVRVNPNSKLRYGWDMEVHDERAFGEILRSGSLGLGESYMRGEWDCEWLDKFFEHVLQTKLDKFIGAINFAGRKQRQQDKLGGAPTPEESFKVGQQHYDIGNDLYAAMLGSKTMAYTCPYFRHYGASLDDAQLAKFDLIASRAKLLRGQRVLDVGCGFGGFDKYVAENYGVSVVGITVSEEQAKFAREFCKGFPVETRVQDYRQLARDERFDRIVSIGSLEHVEYKNYDEHFECMREHLNPDGLLFVHCMFNDEGGDRSDPWIRKYIFPVGTIPGKRRMQQAIGNHFQLIAWQPLGSEHYARGLELWWKNFDDAWPRLRAKYGSMMNGQFYRMWRYYLMSCKGAFEAERLNVVHAVMAPTPRPGYVFVER